jgi:CMP-N,N'-diacetyllegionaminic acid synthase
MKKAVALIPARSGSQRVIHKNIRLLGGHPLIAYTISAALQSGVFDEVVVSTDSEQYAKIAAYYGAKVPSLRPSEIAGETSPDIEWVQWILRVLADGGQAFDAFSILRPTSPFRLPATILRAWGEFCSAEGIDSLRAIEKCSQHPGKMWVVRGHRMFPLLPLSPAEQPWHSSQYKALPEVYVQNASLEIAWCRVVSETQSIAGHSILPFFTRENEGFDVNSEMDWEIAEQLVESGVASLPRVEKDPFVA